MDDFCIIEQNSRHSAPQSDFSAVNLLSPRPNSLAASIELNSIATVVEMSEVDSDIEEAPAHPAVVEIDTSKLTPLSPEVISKQVGRVHGSYSVEADRYLSYTGHYQSGSVLSSTKRRCKCHNSRCLTLYTSLDHYRSHRSCRYVRRMRQSATLTDSFLPQLTERYACLVHPQLAVSTMEYC